ncbi:MAG TPA: PspC domain-containing protein [Chitinophagaceae bacterium]|nr:PspC domain-containing protein [Chitinophagaceae bacterium]
MKKIININLSGRVIPIEDSAYEKLQSYIESLRRYFANEDGRDEIINDIESRIAELMSEKVRKGTTAISDEDVDEIAKSMGRPEDFEAEEADEAKHSQQKSQATSEPVTPRKKSRLFRDSSDKFLGGVCSGIANYLNVDPAIVRILFAIITFGGFGLGVLIYILLWIILPPKDLDGFAGKRLFRNPEDKVIGGVSGGLAAYFGRETWIIRLLFAGPILLNIIFGSLSWPFFHSGNFLPNIFFGSLSGTFILIYIVLWIVLPEARSPYEKMEMRGESVNVSTIKQNVQEGIGSMKDKLKDWSEDVKESAQNLGTKAKEFSNTRGKEFAAEVRQTARPVANGIGHAIGVLFKVFFLFIAGTIAFGLFVALMAIIFGGMAWWPVNNFLWTSNWQQAYAWGTVILFLGVPLVGFLIWLIRRIIGVKSKSNYLGWTFGGLWALGWVSVVLLIASISKDIRYYDYSTPVEIPLVTQPIDNKLIVAVSEPVLEFTDRYWWIDGDSEGWDLSEDTLKMSFVKFNILPSLDSSYHVTIKKYSAGKTNKDVERRAGKIQYHAAYANGVLDLGSGFAIDKDSKYRGQMVAVEIKIPVGKKIRFDESVSDKLNPVNIRVKRNSGWRNGRMRVDIDEFDSFRWMKNTDYIMGVDGELKNADGSPVLKNNYRYNDNDSTRLEKSIEKKKNELKELEERKQEQIKVKQASGASRDSAKKSNRSRGESIDEKDNDDIGISGSPIFSLVQLFN